MIKNIAQQIITNPEYYYIQGYTSNSIEINGTKHREVRLFYKEINKLAIKIEKNKLVHFPKNVDRVVYKLYTFKDKSTIRVYSSMKNTRMYYCNEL